VAPLLTLAFELPTPALIALTSNVWDPGARVCVTAIDQFPMSWASAVVFAMVSRRWPADGVTTPSTKSPTSTTENVAEVAPVDWTPPSVDMTTTEPAGTVIVCVSPGISVYVVVAVVTRSCPVPYAVVAFWPVVPAGPVDPAAPLQTKLVPLIETSFTPAAGQFAPADSTPATTL
jgi:hypothetical protein